MNINGREIGPKQRPFVIAELGINHGGNMAKVRSLIKHSRRAGCECVKIQTHIPDLEMTRDCPIYDTIKACSLTFEQEKEIKKMVEDSGMILLSTPFCIEAVDRLEALGVPAYKIGSGECSNYPLIDYIASKGKPVILSTGMHNLSEVKEAIIHLMDIPLALLHCVSMYPAPYQNVNLNTISKWRELFPYATIGISDHTLGNYISFGAYTLGASIIERHFTVTKYWQGPDIATSIDFEGMCDLIYGLDCLFQSQGDAKDITEGEAPVIKFALARAVTNTDVKKYDEITKDNIIFKRTNNLGISAQHFNDVYGATFNKDMYKGTPVTTEDIK